MRKILGEEVATFLSAELDRHPLDDVVDLADYLTFPPRASKTEVDYWYQPLGSPTMRESDVPLFSCWARLGRATRGGPCLTRLLLRMRAIPTVPNLSAMQWRPIGTGHMGQPPRWRSQALNHRLLGCLRSLAS